MLLLHSVKTPLYSELAMVLKASPLSSLVAASPFVLLLGIFINQSRIVLKKYLFHRPTYLLNKLPQEMQNSLRNKIANELGIEEMDINLNHDSQIEDAKLIMQPQYDEYSIRSRWLHDFLECSILITGFTVIVLVFRALAYPFEGLEWVLLVACLTIGIVAVASIPKLRSNYTIAEAAMILFKSQHSTEAEKATNR